MTDQTKALRDRLVADLTPVRRVLPATRMALVWLGASAVYVLIAMLWLGPIRPGALEQMVAHPRFGAEMLAGVGSLVCFAIVALRLAVPGVPSRVLSLLGWVLGAVWLAHFVVGIWRPPFAPSMLGKRELCVVEAYLYSVPPLLWALRLQRRRYALQPQRAALYAALAAGMIPALAMQITCMYEPVHILQYHVAPIAVLAAATTVGMWLSLSRRKNPEP